GVYLVSGQVTGRARRRRPGAATEPAFVVVAPDGRAAVTGPSGQARFDELPPGSYDIIGWHPPVRAGGPPVTQQQTVTVAAGETGRVTLALGLPGTVPWTISADVEAARWSAAKHLLPLAACTGATLRQAVIERSRRYTSERELLAEPLSGRQQAPDL